VLLGLAFSPDGRWLASAGDGVAIRDTSSWQVRARVRWHQDWTYHVLFSADGEFLISSSADGTARLWPMEVILASVP
jgi:WD40 repeat protein